MTRFLIELLVAFAVQPCLADPDLATMAIVRDADIKWIEGMAPGLSSAVVHGDPAKPGLYIVRVRFAPGTMSPPHKIHFDGTKDEEVVLQITGIGPSATKPVDETGAVK